MTIPKITKQAALRLIEESLTSFERELRRLRRRRGLTQKQLASLTGLHHTYISKIECGKMPPPSTRSIKKLATALSTDADRLTLLAFRIPESIFAGLILTALGIAKMYKEAK